MLLPGKTRLRVAEGCEEEDVPVVKGASTSCCWRGTSDLFPFFLYGLQKAPGPSRQAPKTLQLTFKQVPAGTGLALAEPCVFKVVLNH